MRRALVIGGGPAGASAATRLAAAGCPVTLYERNAVPTDKVCGDFLSGEAITALRDLGLDVFALGAEQVRHLRLFSGDHSAVCELPFIAAGLSRRILDEALLNLAADRGATIHRGHTVRGLDPTHDGATFLATGKHDLRGLPRPARNTGPIGLKTYYVLDPVQAAALASHVELVLLPGLYVGLQQVEDGNTVLCLTVSRARFAQVGGADGLFESLQDSPHLRHRLRGAVPTLEHPMAVAGTPYGFLYRVATGDPPALYRLGDQAAVIPSLTGDGVAIALHSARLATEAWLNNQDAVAYHLRLRRELRRPIGLANLVHAAWQQPILADWIVRLCRQYPSLPRLLARATRVPGA